MNKRQMIRLVLSLIMLVACAVEGGAKSFYVKEDGSGDGSSWKSAMGVEGFSERLLAGVDRDTFYFAEGVYKPVHNKSGQIESSTKNRQFTLSSSVTLIGGFPKEPVEGDKPEPWKYTTLFTGDFNGDDEVVSLMTVVGNLTVDSLVIRNVEDNASTLFDIRDKVGISWYGIQVKGFGNVLNMDANIDKCQLSNCKFYENQGNLFYITNECQVRIDSCVFERNVGECVVFMQSTDVEVSNSYFEQNGLCDVMSSAPISVFSAKIRNCTFNKNRGSDGASIFMYSVAAGAEIVNSTFIGGRSISADVFLQGSELVLVQNCFFANFDCCRFEYNSEHDYYENSVSVYKDSETNLLLVGNIFVGAMPYHDDYYSASYKNVYTKLPFYIVPDSIINKDEDGQLVNVADISTLFEGEYKATVDSFIPLLGCNGAFVPTVKLLQDALSGGKSIRYSKNADNAVFYGYDRFGKKNPMQFNSSSLSSVDVYGNNRSDMTCAGPIELLEQETPHEPDPNSLAFYVKQEPVGTGTGENWANAMGPETFAQVLPEAKDGAKFYVAAGTYKPTNGQFTINSSVSIIGGFPADATEGAVSEPDKYVTEFSGDINGDDEIVEVVEDGKLKSLSFENREDNVKKIFVVLKQNTSLNIEGVTICGAEECGVYYYIGGKTDWYMHNVKFIANSTAIIHNGRECSLDITNSFFENNLSCIKEEASYTFSLKSSCFSKNYGQVFSCTGASTSFLMDSVKFIGNSVSNSNGLVYVNSQSKGVTISNSLFEKNISKYKIISNVDNIKNTLFVDNEAQMVSYIGDVTTNIDSCIFSGNQANCIYIGANSYNSKISNSLFEGNQGTELCESMRAISVSSCTFVDNEAKCLLKVASFEMNNSTVITNNVDNVFYGRNNGKGDGYFDLRNNTIIGNIAKGVPIDISGLNVNLYGNIILGNSFSRELKNGKYDDNVLSKYDNGQYNNNLMNVAQIKNGNIEKLASNIFVLPFKKEGYNSSDYCDLCKYAVSESEEYYLTNLFDGTYDSERELFIPELKYNGGFTPTVALKADVLPNGQSIRFPLSETTVTADQRGVERLEETCMGAYERECSANNVYLSDSVIVGTEYLFNGVPMNTSKIGIVKDTMVLKGEICDTLNIMTLCVMPNPNVLAYYVKVDATGKGDGSSWENAMSAKDFAFVMRNVPEGTTFYVAEGIYKPIYDIRGDIPNESISRVYLINSSVSIIGGFPMDAKEGALSDPAKYETVFSGDIMGDDEVDVNDDNGCISLSVKNQEDNSECVFFMKDENISLSLKGVSLKGGSSYGINAVNNNQTLNASNVYFAENSTAINYPYVGASVNVEHSKFEKNKSYCINIPNGSNVNVKTTDFVQNENYLLFASNSAIVNMDSINVVENKAYIQCVSNTTLKISNSKFTNNACSYYLVEFVGDESQIDISNCEFVGNSPTSCLLYLAGSSEQNNSIRNSIFKDNDAQIITDYIPYLLVDSCKFLNNEEKCLYATRNVDIKSSLFEGNKKNVIEGGFLKVESSTFDKNVSDYILKVWRLKMVNSTIVENSVKTIIAVEAQYDDSEFLLQSSTIVGNDATERPLYSTSEAPARLYGNIILNNTTNRNKRGDYQYGGGVLSELYNIKEIENNLMDIVRKNPQTEEYDMSTWVADNSTNIILKPFEIEGQEIYDFGYCKACAIVAPESEEYYLTNVLDGEYNSETERFIPNLKDNGGFTPTVAIKTDMLPNGQSLRFPISESLVNTDQRGVERDVQICIGSYEIGYSEKVTIKDTVCLADGSYDKNGFKIDKLTAGTTKLSRVENDVLYELELEVSNPQMYFRNCNLVVYSSTCKKYPNGRIEGSGGFLHWFPPTDFYLSATNMQTGEQYISDTISKELYSFKIKIDSLPPADYALDFYYVGSSCPIYTGGLGITGDKAPGIPGILSYKAFRVHASYLDAELTLSSIKDAQCLSTVTLSTTGEGEAELQIKSADVDSLVTITLGGEVSFALPQGKYTATLLNGECNVSSVEFELNPEPKFLASGQVLRKACNGRSGSERAVVTITDTDGKPLKGEFSFYNKKYGALSPIGQDHVTYQGNGVYLVVNAGSPCDTLIIRQGDCMQKVYLTEYELTDADKAFTFLPVKKQNQKCSGAANGAMTFGYKDFDSYCDITIRVNRAGEGYAFFDKNVQGKSNTYTIDTLTPGRYVVSMWASLEGCPIAPMPQYADTITIEESLPMEILSVVPTDNRCADIPTGKLVATVKEWYPSEGHKWAVFLREQEAPDEFHTDYTVDAEGNRVITAYNLPEGLYTFRLVDACGFSRDKNFTINSMIVDSLVIDYDATAYSCPENMDGSVTFKVKNWDEDCFATFGRVAAMPSSVKDGVAIFNVENAGATAYKLYTRNVCDKATQLTFDMEAYSKENGALVIDRCSFGDNPACVVNDRRLNVHAAGKEESFTYRILNADGAEVKAPTKGTRTFVSDILPDGVYQVEVSAKDGCKALSDTVGVHSSVSLTAYKTETTCGASKNTLVVAKSNPKVDATLYWQNGGRWATIGEPMKAGDLRAQLKTNATVSLWAVKAVTADGCEAFAELADYEEDAATAMKNLSAKIDVVNQRCYGMKNGEIRVAYNPQGSAYDLAAVVTDANGKKYNSKKIADDTITVTGLDSGRYEVSLGLSIGDCVLEETQTEAQTVRIAGISHKLEIASDTIEQKRCFTDESAKITIFLYGWAPNTFEWHYYLNDESKHHSMTANDMHDGRHGIVMFAKNGGTAYFEAHDVCGNKVEKTWMVDDFKEKPSAKLEELTNNVCMLAPKAKATFAISEWHDGMAYHLVGADSTAKAVKKGNDVTYSALKNGDYAFVLTDACATLDSINFTVTIDEIDPAEMTLRLDSIALNSLNCFGSETGDVKVYYKGNKNKAEVGVRLQRDGATVADTVLTDVDGVVLFDKLAFAKYDVSLYFNGMEECTSQSADFNRQVTVSKPDSFAVDFFATKAICEGSTDAMIRTVTKAGVAPYDYEWHKVVDGGNGQIINHSVAGHDTLGGLRKEEKYWCKVVDRNGCLITSDTLAIVYDHADSTQVDTFIYDPYQRCKGVDNSQVIVNFAVVSEYASPVYTLLAWNGEAYEAMEVKNSSKSVRQILLDNLAPNKYKLQVGYPSVGCPSLLEEEVEIKALENEFAFAEKADSTKLPHCYANADAAIYFHAVGASRGLTAKLYDGETFIKNISADTLIGDKAIYTADNLKNGTYTVKMTNVCNVEIEQEYAVGGKGFGVDLIDSLSFLALKCRLDSNGVVAFRLRSGDFDSSAVHIRCKSTNVTSTVSYMKVDTIVESVVKDSVAKKDTVWNAAHTEYELKDVIDAAGNLVYEMVYSSVFKDTTIEVPITKYDTTYLYTDYEKAKFARMNDSVWTYSNLPANKYYIDYLSTINECEDSVRVDFSVTQPNRVSFDIEALPISCQTFTDGAISVFASRNGASERPYVLKHDSTVYGEMMDYSLCYLYTKEMVDAGTDFLGDSVKKKSYKEVLYDEKPVMVRINTLTNRTEFLYKDGNSLKSIPEADVLKNNYNGLFGKEWASLKWSKKENGAWKEIKPVMPDSTTYEEDVFYGKGDTIKTPVWAYTHLSTFWEDDYGYYMKAGVQSIANLEKGRYMCCLTDTNNCEYRQEVDVLQPAEVLTIDTVMFNAKEAECDPVMRRIDVAVHGGWGEYNYMIIDENAKGEDGGGAIDAYLGGASMTYNEAQKKGTYRSEFLNPGRYKVAVIDGKGCRIEYSQSYDVKTKFEVTADTNLSICPGQAMAEITFTIKDDSYKGGYLLKEHISNCTTPLDCVQDSFEVREMTVKNNVFKQNVMGGGHGFFVYRQDGSDNCGTYVRVSALDTLKPMQMSLKSIEHVSCNGANDAEVQLYVMGGVAPYTITANPKYGSEEVLAEQKNLQPKVDDDAPKDQRFPYVAFTNLAPRDYYFTITDKMGCYQYMGDTAAGTARISVREPEPLDATFYSSGMCGNEGAEKVLNFGSVSARYVKGGTAPYSYTITGGYEAEKDGVKYKATTYSDEAFVPVAGYKDTKFTYTITDDHGCELSKTYGFSDILVETERDTEFIVSTWSHFGDIIALIDFCGPESSFDSVSYKFYDVNDEINTKFEVLDKRMYIYDLMSNKAARDTVLSFADSRKIPDGFFKARFKLLPTISDTLAKHLTLIRINDTTKTSSRRPSSSAPWDSDANVWASTYVEMTSYFKGCSYKSQRSLLNVAYDDVSLYNGGVNRRKDILVINVSPNPRTPDGDCTVELILSSKVDVSLFFYHMDGREQLSVEVSASEIINTTKHDGLDAYKYTYTFKGNDAFKDVEVVVVAVRTSNDAAGTYILAK